MIGTRLVPLVKLRELDATAYARHARKYEDRPGMLERWVEPLNWRWSDCIFLSPTDPRLLLAAGGGARLHRREWFMVEASQLDPARAVLMIRTLWSLSDGPPTVTTQQCNPFTFAALADAATPTEKTLSPPRDPANRLPLWADVIHLLYRGQSISQKRRYLPPERRYQQPGAGVGWTSGEQDGGDRG